MSVTHQPCPKCRSVGKDRRGDNLAVYEDGGQYCFSCGYYVAKEVTVESVKEKTNGDGDRPPDAVGISLPGDSYVRLGPAATAWLGKYKLTSEETQRFLWSESTQKLIYPVYGPYGLIMWSGREFSERPKTKYYTCGNPKTTFAILRPDLFPPLVLVEDAVSAIKVARVCAAMPLFGSSISKKQLIILRDHIYSGRLIFWLDRDKMKDSLKLMNQAKELGFDSSIISTDDDPKCLDTETIRSLIHG